MKGELKVMHHMIMAVKINVNKGAGCFLSSEDGQEQA
jgi:hypothetical protein